MVTNKSNRRTALEFIARINAQDAEGLAALMSDDHTFIDAHGNQLSGREQMTAGWRGYFAWFPDYRIEADEFFEANDTVVVFGFAGGSFHGKPSESWRVPAAFRAMVKDGVVTMWQVYADTKSPFDIIERNT